MTVTSKGTATLGVLAIVLSFGRELLSLTADVLQVANGLSENSTGARLVSSIWLRLGLLVLGLFLLYRSTAKTRLRPDQLQDHRSRVEIETMLERSFEEGRKHLSHIPQELTLRKTNQFLLTQVIRLLSERFGELMWRISSEEPEGNIYAARLASAYGCVLELLMAGESVKQGTLWWHRDVEVWAASVSTLESRLRVRVGDSEIDKMRSFLSRDLGVRVPVVTSR